jgi:hypothetical protein
MVSYIATHLKPRKGTPKYANDLSEKINVQWEGNICTDNFSKDKRNFIRYKKCVSP